MKPDRAISQLLRWTIASGVVLSLACVDYVGPTRATALRVGPSSVTLSPGETTEYTAEVVDEDGNVLEERADLIEWRILNPAVASIEPARDRAAVTALQPGPTMLRVAHSVFREDVEVFVQPPGLARIALVPDTMTLNAFVGGVTVRVHLLDEAGAELAPQGFRFDWAIADSTVARIPASIARATTVRVLGVDRGETTLRSRVGKERATAEVTVILEPLRHEPPTVVTVSASSLALWWERNRGMVDGGTGCFEGYRVERASAPDGPFGLVATPGRSCGFAQLDTTYIDRELEPGTTYYYRVSACNPYGCSVPSPTASGTTAAGG